MNHFEKDEIQILSETRLQQSEDLVDSNFQRNISRTQSASISIPVASLDPHETQPNLAGHIAPLHTVRKTSFVLMSGPLYALLQQKYFTK
jgi:cyclic nucleotide gated channel